MKKVSIVVPVYNVEKYLDQCLESLVHQTLEDIEIIVVNDGTKDNSQTIINQYVEMYPDKVISLIKENGGLASARNYGIPYATGEYLGFLDSDDYVELDTYERMYVLAKDNQADLAVADLEYFWDENEQEPFVMKGLNSWSDDIQKALFLSPLFAWNKLYKRDFFTGLGLQYPNGLWYEDIPVTLPVFANARKAVYCPYTGFHYRQRKSSIMGSSYNPKMFDIFTIFDLVMQNLSEESKKCFYDELEYLIAEHFLLYGAFRFLRTEEYRALMMKGFEKSKEMFPQVMHNKYLKNLSKKNQIFIWTNNAATMHFWHWYLGRR